MAQLRLTTALAARKVVQEAAATVQRAAHDRLAGVVSRCLAAVFGPTAYEFRLEFEEKRGRTEARPVFVRDGNEADPTAVGGGVVDVAAFALRVAAVAARQPPVRRLLVLDEPLRHLSKDYRPRARALLETLAADLKFQIILITHDPALECGEVIRIG